LDLYSGLFKPALATALRSDEESNIEHTSKKSTPVNHSIV